MLLAIDVGNTNIVIGVFGEDKLKESWRLSTDKTKTADEYRLLIAELFHHSKIKTNKIEAVIIACVVPSILNRLTEMCSHTFHIEPMVINADLEIGASILYDNPRELGADRLANAIGGYSEYGGPLIIVDFGTTTNFDVVSSEGGYLGGAIAPGVGTSAEMLSERAALLPRIDIRTVTQAIGKNTISSMQSGLYFSFLGQMEEIIRRIKKELSRKPKVIATGGLAEIIASESDLVDIIDPDITLKGLKIIYKKVAGDDKI
ncbi:type III pantothenate kinase [Candidatus Poribacteria bacterium]|nr:type III pantothenate kinase [Candidatus Poribacteria bacterium]